MSNANASNGEVDGVDLDELLHELYKDCLNESHTEEFVDNLFAAIEEKKRKRNDPLTLEQLRKRTDPVWVPLESMEGFWCLCCMGTIITPSMNIFKAEHRPNWDFYDKKVEVKDNGCFNY